MVRAKIIMSGNNSYGPLAGSVGTTMGGSTSTTLEPGIDSALGAGDEREDERHPPCWNGSSLANNIIISNRANATVNNNGNAVTLSGIISGAGGLIKNGAGTPI